MGKDFNGIRATIIGSGNWGTAFSKVLVDAGTQTSMLTTNQSVLDSLRTKHEHPNYPDVHISRRLKISDDPRILLDQEIIFLVIPAQVLRSALQSYANFIPQNAIVCSLIKGIEAQTLKPMSEVIAETFSRARSQKQGIRGAGISLSTETIPAELITNPQLPITNRVAVLSGPNLASEIIQRQPAAATIASSNLDTAYRVAQACDSGYFKTFVSSDVLGVELCGDLKNVIAIAAGMLRGIGLGYNTLASLITRGLKEISEIGVNLGAKESTFMGLSGVGDLIATCASSSSRNFTLGYKLASGISLDQALQSSQGVAEGYYTVPSALKLAERYRLAAPIIRGVYQVLYKNRKCQDMLMDLLNADIDIE
ncbi:MAG: NAD(P)-dependent glycerol-3-phosphate dehydrogenase [Bifidobacteriaceae bacterium]|nr:NAD(P)-dependent glycerol-3-phosphate dehydrogenase [Bifidobacteriaceae bacterium]